ncbi:Nucleoporin nup189 [Ceratocystis platani]|uniref:Nucleoporin nup189 n=1 Tax=Ceratocystis fimbriata f. sp. platani TaxID=88771 RepID=A0A0F8BXB8_CERFI|nr:Nucleoporin nup189 [Ceratocystis platani]
MSFGGFGGFGQSNNNNQSSGGFGFGANTNNTSTPGGFGSTNTTSAFGANKSTFGTPASGGGLFGSSNNNNNTTTSGNTFGAFGGNNNTTTTSGFGSSSGNGLFGANKPATTGTGFGSTSAGGGLFGGGGTNTPSGFGAVNNPGIGNAGDPPGTNTIPFQAYQEKEGGSSTTTNSFQNILFQDAYKKWSADELRLVDYAQGRRFGNASGGGAFGVNAFGSGTSAFGTSNNTNQTQTSAFGSSISGGGGGLFGANNNTTTTNSTGFGTNNNNTTSAFGSGGGGGLFGNNNAAKPGGLFGAAQTTTPATGGGLFGNNAANNATTTTNAFGAANNANSGTTGGGLFGAAKPATSGGLFGNNAPAATAGGGVFGNAGAANTTIQATGDRWNGGFCERGIKASVSMPSLHDSVKGNELAIVHEEEIGSPVPTPSTGKDSLPGQYWMSPSIKDLSSMNRLQRQSVVDFTVGRENVGQVQFKVPVDLSNIDIDDIVDNIVILETRSATVYPIAEKKPPMGRGLNVPARITLEQSWPRGKRDTSDEKRIAKHVNRLRRIVDTEFEEYDSESGVWVFSVEHFTTYGLDDEDESDVDATEFPEFTETALAAPQNQVDLDGECSILSPSSDSFGSDPDDTFDFRNKRLALPGTFDSVAATNTQPRVESHLQSFLGVSSVGSGPNQIMLSVEDSDLGDEYAASEGEDMASLTTGKHHAAEHFEDYSSASSEVMEEDMNNDESEDDDLGDDEEAPGGGVLRARMRALKMSAGPVRVEVTDGDDWMDMLKKTVSPVKRDRVQFRDGNAELMPMNLAAQPGIVDSEEEERELLGIIGEGRGFATTIDLMNSLFERPSSKPKPQPQPRGFVQVRSVTLV